MVNANSRLLEIAFRLLMIIGIESLVLYRLEKIMIIKINTIG